MSVFTTPVGKTDNSGIGDDMFTRNALTCAGTGALLGLGSGSMLAVAVAAPLQFAGISIAAGGCIYAGNRIADGKSVNPWAQDKDSTTKEPTPEATPVAVVAS